MSQAQALWTHSVSTISSSSTLLSSLSRVLSGAYTCSSSAMMIPAVSTRSLGSASLRHRKETRSEISWTRLCKLHTAPPSLFSKKRDNAAKKGDVEFVDPKRITSDFQAKSDKVVDACRTAMSSIRGTRAAPGMLDALRVKVTRDGASKAVPMRDVAQVSVRSPQLLVVNPFSPDLKPSIVKALLDSKLGLNPSEQGEEVLVPVPKPSMDQVREYLKAAKAHVTEAKKNLSHIRSDVNKVVRDIDDKTARNLLTRELDKVTEGLNRQLEDLLKHKEKELQGS